MKKTLPLFAIAIGTLCSGCASRTDTAAAPNWEEQFRKADLNNDGRVSRDEFGQLMIEDAFRLFDANKDGVVTLKEYVANGGSPAAFSKIDRNGDGKVTLEEAKSSKFAIDAMTVSFYGADTNNDGYVTMDEALSYRERVRPYTR